MPIFKVTMTERTTKTFVAYVDVPTKEAADHWACMVEDADAVGRCIREQTDEGAVEDVEAVDVAPTGWRVLVPAHPADPSGNRAFRTELIGG